MSELDALLSSIISSSKATKLAVDELTETLSSASEDYPDFIHNLLEKSKQAEPEGISLLQLKNQALASYINNLALIVLSHLERLEEHGDNDNSDGENKKQDDRDEAIQRSIVQRVTLEKGVKPLERKITYQIENLVRAYNKMEAQQKAASQKAESAANLADSELGSSHDQSELDSDEEDELAYRPDASSFAKLAKQGPASTGTSSTTSEKYKPPKISAMAPPTSTKSAAAATTPGTASDKATKRLQSMEEYLQDQSDLPMAEASIGSTIVQHGRGGVKTQHDRQKEREIQRYEEANFTRLPTTQTKKSFREKQRDLANQFAGEDWSMFSSRNDRDLSKDTSRKRKAGTSWDRAKKKRL
ncbi:uncharacterized protein LODBEIA_P34550 [Lodderomyces beijingensis]|uniref:Uncharacterized protein n=1 Tax=Lodderomyces beijingensis TaxID=1775926 RepID=A0ABP0ZQ48_9ASCO